MRTAIVCAVLAAGSAVAWWVDIIPQLSSVTAVVNPDWPDFGQPSMHEAEVVVGWEVPQGKEGFVELWVRDSGLPAPAGIWVNVDRTVQKGAGVHSDTLEFVAGGVNPDVNMHIQYDIEVRLFEYDSQLGPQLIGTDSHQLRLPIGGAVSGMLQSLN